MGKESRVRHYMLRFIAASAVVALPLWFAAGQTQPPNAANTTAAGKTLPDGPGKQLVLKNCQSCHSLERVTSKRGNADDWAQTVSQMIGRGANLSDDDADTVVQYLADHFGPSAPKPNQATPPGTASPSASSTAPSSGGAPTSAAQGDASGSPLNVNKATAGELESRLGLTQADADAIVHYREKNGDFKNLQEVLSVPGIDAEKIRHDQNQIAF